MESIGAVFYINRASRLNLFLNVFIIVLISIIYNLIYTDFKLLHDEVKTLHSIQDKIISNQEEIKTLLSSSNKETNHPEPLVKDKIEVIKEKK